MREVGAEPLKESVSGWPPGDALESVDQGPLAPSSFVMSERDVAPPPSHAAVAVNVTVAGAWTGWASQTPLSALARSPLSV